MHQQKRMRGTRGRRAQYRVKDQQEAGGVGAHRKATQKSRERAPSVHGGGREAREGVAEILRCVHGEAPQSGLPGARAGQVPQGRGDPHAGP